jgi:uncharacterized hydrophobic protein (TIGR00271 family)
MIDLEVFGTTAAMQAVAGRLDDIDGVSRVRLVDASREGYSVVSASLRPRTTDLVLDDLRRHGVADSDIELRRVELVGSLATGRAEASLVWADVIGTAWLNARPIARYLAFMLAAGVIASYGVIDENVILIVGAMAVSPDLLPITGIGVGVVARLPGLAVRAFLTLALGLGAASVAAAVSAFAQGRLDLLPTGFDLQEAGVLGALTTVSNETIVVALVAGVAGMLALETRASSGVGVAISVTTIPASAYLGVAFGLGEFGEASGALEVLGTNVLMMVIGAVATLELQGVRARRRIARATPGSDRPRG